MLLVVRYFSWALIAAAFQVHAATTIVNSTQHADTFIAPAVIAVLGSNSFQIDYDPISASPSNIAVTLTHSSDTSYEFVSVASGLTANHAPYNILNASICQYTVANDLAFYPALLAQNAIYTIPIGGGVGSCGLLPNGTEPGVLISTATSTNSGDGATGWGTEFALSASYKGLNTTEDSWDSAALAGFYASMTDASQHPTWNFFDIKAAFRQTASNWSTGYNSATYGYGIFNYDLATAIGSTSSLYLQPPGMVISPHFGYAIVALIPYRQTRRTREVVYSVSAAYSFPIKNEFTTADITASGATLLYTSNGTDVEPTYTFMPTVNGSVTFIAFTTDGLGNYSRFESFSEQTVSLSVATSCIP